MGKKDPYDYIYVYGEKYPVYLDGEITTITVDPEKQGQSIVLSEEDIEWIESGAPQLDLPDWYVTIVTHEDGSVELVHPNGNSVMVEMD